MEFANPDYLVSPDWLEARLGDDQVRILDVTAKLNAKLDNTAGEAAYQERHPPGSLFFDVPAGKGALSNPDEALPWMWPTPEQLTTSLAEVGVGADTRVVLVARTPRPGIDSGTMWCTRAWWTLHHYGVDCSILHGGIERWEAEGRPLTSDTSPVPDAAPFGPAEGWEAARATKDDVLAGIASDEPGTSPVCVVDALPAESFDGTGTTYGPRGGHITGAVNVPFRTLIEAETAGFVDAEAMHAHLSEAGLLEAPRVITYCGGAIAATVDAFALALLGHDNVAVYDGSLMEWTVDPDLPMTDPSDAG